jgi:glycosyltransferase EpsF
MGPTDKRAPRVLHLITWLQPGGIEKWLLSMLKTIPRDEYELDFCCKGSDVGELAPVARDHGSKVLLNPLRPTHVGYAKRLRRILDDGDYDIVHNHMANYSGIGTWAARKESVPVIASFHNTEFPPETWTRAAGLRQARDLYSNASMGYAVRRSDYVTGCSRATLEAVLDNEPRSTDRVLYYGVDLPEIRKDAAATVREEIGVDNGARLVLHVGRIIEQKNHEGLLRIFARIAGEVEDAYLLLVGDGPLRARVEEQVRKLGLEERVKLLGLRKDVPRLMMASDVLLFPSLHEGFGLVATEANAAGLPVVGTAIPGLTEAVEDGVTGVLHDVKDEAGMAQSTLRLLNDIDEAQKMGAAGRERVQREFTLQQSAERLTALYDECLSNR